MPSAVIVVIDYRTEMLMKKISRHAKNRESRRQRQSGAEETELQDLQLGVVMSA